MATTLSFSSSVGAIDLCQELIFLLARPVWFPKLKWLSSSVAFVIVYLQPDPLAFPPQELLGNFCGSRQPKGRLCLIVFEALQKFLRRD